MLLEAFTAVVSGELTARPGSRARRMYGIRKLIFAVAPGRFRLQSTTDAMPASSNEHHHTVIEPNMSFVVLPSNKK